MEAGIVAKEEEVVAGRRYGANLPAVTNEQATK
jgi:hypothetical protein